MRAAHPDEGLASIYPFRSKPYRIGGVSYINVSQSFPEFDFWTMGSWVDRFACIRYMTIHKYMHGILDTKAMVVTKNFGPWIS